jgi:2-methylisocitrate lyase-like PEP mutase family enzyme
MTPSAASPLTRRRELTSSTRRTCRTWPPSAQFIRAIAPKPVNVLVSPQRYGYLAELQTIGVRRISLGVDPYTHALGATQAAAAKLAKGDLTALASNLNFGHIIDLIKG